MIGHVIERFIIHIFSGASVVLIALWGFWIIERKIKWFPELRGWMFYIFPSLIAFTFISFREVFDVANGGPVIKSLTDWTSWLIGLVFAVYTIYRLTPKFSQVLTQIEEKRREK